MSLRIAKKRKVSQESIKEEWAKIREEAEERGSAYHKSREQAQLKKSGSYKHISNATYKLSLDLANLEAGFYPELMLVHPNFNIAGTADSVEIFSDGTFNLSDYKTNKSLDFNSFQVYDQRLRKRIPKMMFEPVSHLEDCNGNHYALQLSMYAYILESYGYKLNEMWIDHIVFEDNEVVDIIKYPIRYLKEEVASICRDYTIKNFLNEDRN